MTQQVSQFHKLQNYIDYVIDWNPQLLREIKGRINSKKIIATTVAAISTQLFIVINFLGKLPDNDLRFSQKSSELIYTLRDQYSRYCTGIKSEKTYYYRYKSLLCYSDMHNHWMINWELFWFDIFVTLSVIGIALLLLLGTCFLINNVTLEQKKGTLNLVRLSPQSASNILLGKILGVPILLYFFIALGLPLHTVAAFKASIPLHLNIAFDLAIIASCGFFYSLSLLLSFAIPKSINAWIAAIAIGLFLIFGSIANGRSSETVLDWLLIFNPNYLIPYVGKITGIADYYTSSIVVGSKFVFFDNVLFYGQALWKNIGLGIGLVIANYCLWTYWIWQGLKRCFYNPENTVISKQQSYWITGYFTAIALGFSLQSKGEYFSDNIAWLILVLLVFFLSIIFALTPQRQTLYDWARYRHQMKKRGNVLWRELIFGEKSPSTVAIAINALIATLYIIPSLVLFSSENINAIGFWSLISTVSMVVLFAAIAQLMLLRKGKHRVTTAFATIFCLMFGMPLIEVLGIIPYNNSLVCLFTPFSLAVIKDTAFSTIAVAVLGQWLAITLVSVQITRKLRQAGRSQTYKIVNSK